jgi:hypothetical protein
MGMKEPSPGQAVSKPVVTKPAGHPQDKVAWTNPICADGIPAMNGQLMWGITRTGQCSGWCGTMEIHGTTCKGGDEVKQKRDACCAGFPPCPKLPKCKF